jgi:alpha-glucosidase
MGARAAAADLIVRSDGAEIHSGPWFMRVTALADDILRVRAAAAEDLPEDASWAVPEEMRGRSVHVSVEQNVDGIGFRTAALAVRIERSPLRLIVSDLAGHVVSTDAPTGAVPRRRTHRGSRDAVRNIARDHRRSKR